MLEDLLEQEKREQERQLSAGTTDHDLLQNPSQSPNRIEYDRLKRDINTSSHTMTAQGIVPLKTTQSINLLQTQSSSTNKPQFMPRAVNHQQWRNPNNLQLLPP